MAAPDPAVAAPDLPGRFAHDPQNRSE